MGLGRYSADPTRARRQRPRSLTAVTVALCVTASSALAGAVVISPASARTSQVVVGATRRAVAGGQAVAVRQPAPTPEPGFSPAQRLEQLIGPGSVNSTDTRWNLYGADLGHMFFNDGALYMVFGDSFGAARGDWRSNTMARLVSPDPRQGLRFDSMITDGHGTAAQLLSSMKVDGREMTVIPTYGVSVGKRMYLQYMSVRHWASPGRWDLNYSGLAYSDDGGHTWVKDAAARWPGDSNFGQVAMVPVGAMIYIFGIPGGRFGGARLARVPAVDLLDLADYRYWDGNGWTPDPRAAATVVPAPVGELSVRWSAAAQRWLMMYLDEARSAIVVRTATAITGPWSGEQVVATSAQYPDLYGPYMVPVDTGPDIYFTMSQFGPYEVFLMKTELKLTP